jgi:non-specific serine/threonine protein kinase
LKLRQDEISYEAVAAALKGRKLLIVLDNCEHVIDAAAKLIERVVQICSKVSILATSREILRIEGEIVYCVPPLEVPPHYCNEPSAVVKHAAVQFFVARTRALRPDLSIRKEDLSAIAVICRRLDGIPLAVEFAAARAATLGVEEVARRLDEGLDWLTGSETALTRHRSLRTVLDWSYELLPESERRLLRRLAIFPAQFTLEASSAVMGVAADAMSMVADGIAKLVAKSLVTLDLAESNGRWRMLGIIRAYALEKLAESGEAEQASRRAADFFRDFSTSRLHGD